MQVGLQDGLSQVAPCYLHSLVFGETLWALVVATFLGALVGFKTLVSATLATFLGALHGVTRDYSGGMKIAGFHMFSSHHFFQLGSTLCLGLLAAFVGLQHSF
jgi:hypothetical protein